MLMISWCELASKARKNSPKNAGISSMNDSSNRTLIRGSIDAIPTASKIEAIKIRTNNQKNLVLKPNSPISNRILFITDL